MENSLKENDAFEDLQNEMIPQYKQSISRLRGLANYFTSEELDGFLKTHNFKDEGVKTQGSRFTNMAIITENINTQLHLADQKKLLDDFNRFFLKSVHEKNKIFGISYFGLNKGFFSMKVKEFMENIGWDKQEKIEIFQRDPRMGKFDEVYHKINVKKDGSIEGLDIIYSRAYMTLNDVEKDPKENHVEYIRIHFDVEEEKVFFYFQYPIASVGKVTNSTFKTFVELKKLIFQVFKLTIINPDTEKQVFKVYKKYTEDNEQKYTQMLDTIDKSESPSKKSLFNNFYETVVSKLKEKVSFHDSNIYIERIKRVFIRLYADNHFDEFTKNIKRNEGYITGFIYKDTLGSSVTGKNGYGLSLDDVEINPLQASDTYFDNRDTIYADEKLFSVRVKLQSSVGPFFERDVRFQAFDGVLLIHFIKEPVSEEKVEYVLRQFESIV